jgi:hypothetical protein
VPNSSDITVTKTTVDDETVLKIELTGQTSSTNNSIRFNHPGGSFQARLLVVGGGGAGGFATETANNIVSLGGGGGGGQVRSESLFIAFGMVHSFDVGAGGRNNVNSSNVVPAGTTSFNIVGPQSMNLTARGGGFGASNPANNQNGSGGGGGGGGSSLQGGTSSDGNDGGSVTDLWGNRHRASAGGGGAGGLGQTVIMHANGDPVPGGNGGIGTPLDITGTNVLYGGGGGGGGVGSASMPFGGADQVHGVGGDGGGGAFFIPGTNGLGGGGGGSTARLDNSFGQNTPPGGNGVIIIRYKTLL